MSVDGFGRFHDLDQRSVNTIAGAPDLLFAEVSTTRVRMFPSTSLASRARVS